VRFGLPPEIVEAIASAPAPAGAGTMTIASAE